MHKFHSGQAVQLKNNTSKQLTVITYSGVKSWAVHVQTFPDGMESIAVEESLEPSTDLRRIVLEAAKLKDSP